MVFGRPDCRGPPALCHPGRHPLSHTLRAAGAWEDAAAAKQEQEALATLSTNLAALVTAHDSVLSDESALGAARASLAELLSVGSMEEADAKIDSLAASGRLDPALLLTLGRAYNGVKESEYTREEVRGVAFSPEWASP